MDTGRLVCTLFSQFFNLKKLHKNFQSEDGAFSLLVTGTSLDLFVWRKTMTGSGEKNEKEDTVDPLLTEKKQILPYFKSLHAVLMLQLRCYHGNHNFHIHT